MYKKFTTEELEREYSPSSCIEDINVYIEQYIQSSKAATAQALEDKSVLLNLRYGDNEDQLIDLYLPSDNIQAGLVKRNNRKLQVYIHGGYWQALTKAESSFAANNFQQQGCYFAVINYSLAPNATLTDIVEQNRQAIAWLASNASEYGFDAGEIYLSGSSAGAHLAIMMLQTHWQNYLKSEFLVEHNKPFIKGVCAVSGIYDIRPLVDTTINNALQLSAEEVQQYSPFFHDISNLCPVIIAFGDNETTEFKRQSTEMAAKIQQSGADVQQNEIVNRNHFDVILDLSSPNTWLSQQVFRQMGIGD